MDIRTRVSKFSCFIKPINRCCLHKFLKLNVNFVRYFLGTKVNECDSSMMVLQLTLRLPLQTRNGAVLWSVRTCDSNSSALFFGGIEKCGIPSNSIKRLQEMWVCGGCFRNGRRAVTSCVTSFFPTTSCN